VLKLQRGRHWEPSDQLAESSMSLLPPSLRRGRPSLTILNRFARKVWAIASSVLITKTLMRIPEGQWAGSKHRGTTPIYIRAGDMYGHKCLITIHRKTDQTTYYIIYGRPFYCSYRPWDTLFAAWRQSASLNSVYRCMTERVHASKV